MFRAGEVHDGECIFVAFRGFVRAPAVFLPCVSRPIDALVPKKATCPFEGGHFFKGCVKELVSVYQIGSAISGLKIGASLEFYRIC